MQYKDNTGELKGMRIDVGNELAKRLCLKPNFVAMDFAPMVPGLQAGRYDMLNTGLFFTEERAKTIIFIPNEQQAFSISVAPGNPKKIAKLDDLNGKVVSTEFGSFADRKLHALDEEFRKGGASGMTVNSLENLTIAFQAMRASQVDAVLTVDAAAFEYEKRGTSQQVMHGLFPVTAGLGFKKRDLAEKVLIALQSMKEDGSYDKLLASYGVSPFPDAFALKGTAN
jgi:polar amino acid transport system substrate-binding protein